MKKFQNRKYLLKEAGILMIVSILLSSNFFTSAQTIDNLPYNLQINDQVQYKLSDSSYSDGSDGLKEIFLEDFENEIIPPTTPDFGTWENTSISPQTWYIDNTDPGDGDYCATVKRGDYDGLMDEQLITPRLDFNIYDKVILKFRWYTSRYAALSKNFMDLNVSIAIEYEQNWTWLWNENNVNDFWSFEWYNCELDLTDYAAKEPNVWLCFQFNSWDPTNDDYYQEYSIDTVSITVNAETDFRCDCGPDETVSWSYNDIKHIKFEAHAFGGTPKYHDWEWDFGDGNFTKEQYPTHNYSGLGVFTVTLTVKDKDNYIAQDTKTITVQEHDPSDIKVRIRDLSLGGIIFEVRNTGLLNVTDISWYVEVIWAMETNKDMITGKNISFLNSGKKKIIRAWSPLLFFVQGPIEVRVGYQPFNRNPDDEVREGIKIGPLMFFYPQ